MRKTLAVATLVVIATGCRKPAPAPSPIVVENALVVSSELAPALPEAEDDEPASMILRKGEVLLKQRGLPRLKWEGKVLDGRMDRDADVVEASLAPRGSYVYVFASDLKEASVPATSHFCATAPKEAAFTVPCAEALRRFVLEGDEAVGFLTCGAVACPVAFAKGADVTWSRVPGLTELYPATLGTRRVLIATAHFQRSLAETGRKVVVLGASPGLPVLGELLLDEIDSRSQVVTSRSGVVAVRGDALELLGTRREVDKTSGKELSNEPVREVWRLGADGKLARK